MRLGFILWNVWDSQKGKNKVLSLGVSVNWGWIRLMLEGTFFRRGPVFVFRRMVNL